NLEELATDMGRTARTTRCHADLAWIGLSPGNELRNRLGRIQYIHFHYEGQAADHRDRNDIADEIEAEMLVQGSIARARLRDQEKRVTVRGRTHDCLDANIGATTRPILYDECLPQTVRKPLPVIILNSSPAVWFPEPMPADAMLILPA